MVEAPSLASRFASRVDPNLKAKAKAILQSGGNPIQAAAETGLNIKSIRTWAKSWLQSKPLTQVPSGQRVTIQATQTVSRPAPSRARDTLTAAVESLADRAKACEDLDLACSSVDRLARAGKNLELWSGANSIVETSVAMLYEQAAHAPAEPAAIDVESKPSGSG